MVFEALKTTEIVYPFHLSLDVSREKIIGWWEALDMMMVLERSFTLFLLCNQHSLLFTVIVFMVFVA
jgi:hypothetical protein